MCIRDSDRSERIFNNLSEIKSYKQSSLEYLIKIYESTKEWERAIDLVKTIDTKYINNEKTNSLLAQYYCEISSVYETENQIEKAIAISKKALKTNTGCIRANLQLAKYYSQNDIAYISLSSASGLELLSEEERNCMITSSFGTGELIYDALTKGSTTINLFIGGSATNDGAIGIASALGYRFYDSSENLLSPIGENLSKIKKILY